MISVRQIHPLFAAEVTGVDLATLTPDQVAALQDASNRHAVLVFPGQSLNDDRLLSLGRLFGDVEPPRNHRVQQRLKHAELADISNLTAANELRAKRRSAPPQLARQPALAFGRLVPRGAGRAVDAVRAHRSAGRRRDRVCRSARRLRRARCRHEGEDRGPRVRTLDLPFARSARTSPTTPTPSAPPCRRCGIRWCGYIRDHGAERSTWARTPRTSSAGRCPTGASCCAT